MTSLDQQINDAKARVAELEEQKWTSREYIERTLGPCPVADRVTRIEPVKGWTNSRKNACPYRGFNFTFDDVKFEVSTGSNWCSSFSIVGAINTNDYVDIPSWENYDWEQPNVVSLIFGDNSKPVAIGLLLLYRNGFVG